MQELFDTFLLFLKLYAAGEYKLLIEGHAGYILPFKENIVILSQVNMLSICRTKRMICEIHRLSQIKLIIYLVYTAAYKTQYT